MLANAIRKISVILALILIITGCNRSEPMKTDTLATINNEQISEAEMILYLLQVKTSFEEIGGKDVWDTEDFSGGKTAEQVAKEGALENLIKVKVLNNKGKSLNVSLTPVQIDETTQAAKDYFAGLDNALIEKYKISEELVVESFLEFRLSTAVNESITGQYEPEEAQIQDTMLKNEDYAKIQNVEPREALTTTVVMHVMTNTVMTDTDGSQVELSEEARQAAYDKILKAREEAVSGVDFETIVENYSEEESIADGNIENKLSVALLDEPLKSVFAGIGIGGITGIAETTGGYHFFKVVDIIIPSDDEIGYFKSEFRVMEEKLREDAISNLKNVAFEEIYSEWKTESIIDIDELKWEQMRIFDVVV